MKKLIFCVLFTFVGLMNVSAQEISATMNENGWTTINDPGDELKGTKPSIGYVWSNDVGSFVYKSTDENLFIIKTKEGIFDSDTRRGATGKRITVGIVGLYSTDNELVDKLEIVFEVADGSKFVSPNKYTLMGGNNYKKSRKVIDYLNNKTGYIRILLPRYSDKQFDMKVNCNS